MKKLLLILCACAILLTATACSCASDTTDAAETTDETGEALETVDVDGDGVSDGNLIEGTPGNSEGADNSGEEKDPEVTPETDVMKSEVIAAEGSEPDLWPTESIPENVPVFEDYSYMYDVTHDEYEESEQWYLSFDSTEDDFDEYIAKIEKAGYKHSEKIPTFWANGEQILDIFTEEVDGEFCVSIDIIKANPVVYPDAIKAVFPEFTVTDSTLYGWYVPEGKPNMFSVSYVCGDNFAADLNAYKNKLVEAGFAVTADEAYLEKDGKTYTVRYGDSLSAYEDELEFEIS